jgi:sugar lactone lactonase YvrE
MAMEILRPWRRMWALAVVAGIAVPLNALRADLLVSTFDSSSVLRLDETTGVLLTAGQIASGNGGLQAAAGVAIGPDGNVYVSSRSTGQILRYNSATGDFLGIFATLQENPSPVPEDPPLAGAPAHLEFGPDGDLYVADSGGTSVERYDGTTGQFVEHAVTGLGSASGFTFGPQGEMYVADFAGPQLGQAAVYRVENGVPTPLIQPLTSPVQTPNGIVLVDESLLVADLFGNQILRYDMEGNFEGVFATILPPIPDPLPAGAQYPSNFPSEMILDRDGSSLLVAVLGIDHNSSGTILRYGLDGTYIETLAEGLAAPSALTLAPAVPEPAAGLLMLAGGALAWGIARRRR